MPGQVQSVADRKHGAGLERRQIAPRGGAQNGDIAFCARPGANDDLVPPGGDDELAAVSPLPRLGGLPSHRDQAVPGVLLCTGRDVAAERGSLSAAAVGGVHHHDRHDAEQGPEVLVTGVGVLAGRPRPPDVGQRDPQRLVFALGELMPEQGARRLRRGAGYRCPEMVTHRIRCGGVRHDGQQVASRADGAAVHALQILGDDLVDGLSQRLVRPLL